MQLPYPCSLHTKNTIKAYGEALNKTLEVLALGCPFPTLSGGPWGSAHLARHWKLSKAIVCFFQDLLNHFLGSYRPPLVLGPWVGNHWSRMTRVASYSLTLPKVRGAVKGCQVGAKYWDFFQNKNDDTISRRSQVLCAKSFQRYQASQKANWEICLGA